MKQLSEFIGDLHEKDGQSDECLESQTSSKVNIALTKICGTGASNWDTSRKSFD
jgi:hypothetical protein